MNNCRIPRIPAFHFKFDITFVVVETTMFIFYQLCTLGLYVTSNDVKLMFIALFQFHVCYHPKSE